MGEIHMRCRGCRAEVGPTLHTHSAFYVQGFKLFAGDRVHASIQGRDDDSAATRDYLRLVDPVTFWLCPTCIDDTEIVRRLYPGE